MSSKEMLMDEINLLNEEQCGDILRIIRALYEIPNEETRRAIAEAERGENLVGPFASVRALMEDLNADD